jgi:hypothetical protein
MVYYGYVLCVYYGQETRQGISGRRHRLLAAGPELDQEATIEESTGDKVKEVQVDSPR